jgi:flagellar biosynthesis/type III secretory pathway protein FliH
MTSLSRLIRGTPEPTESYPVTPDIGSRGSVFEGGCRSDGQDGPEETSPIQQAYQTGYEAGYAACSEAGRAEVGEQVKAFTSAVDDLNAQRKRLMTESETGVVRLSCEIARKIVGRLGELDERFVVEIVKSALNHLVDKQKVVIRVNPDDLEVLKRYESEWLAAAGLTGAVEMKQDSRIKRGGCLVEGDSGNVEAQIDRQIEVIEKALAEAAK